MARTKVRSALLFIVLFAAYVAAARFGLALAFVTTSATAVWPPTGIALAAVLLFGPSIWPAVAAGAFVANVITSGSVAMSLGIAAGNVLEALVGGYLVSRFAGGLDAFRTVPGAFRFVAAAGIVPPAISATIGVSSLVLGGEATAAAFHEIWFTWWLGDAVGALLYAPCILFWLRPSGLIWRAGRVLEAIALLGAVIVTALLNFGQVIVDSNPPLAFLSFPVIVWAAFRFTQREAVSSAVVMSIVALWGTLNSYGQFARASENESLLFVQSFSAVLAIMGTAIGALASQHRHLLTELEDRVAERTAQLRTSEQRLLDAQAAAHVGSWEWDVAADRVWWSDEMCRLYGEAPGFRPDFEEFLARVHHEDREDVRSIVSRAFEDGRPFVFEHRIVLPDESVLALAATGHVVKNDKGQPVRMLGTGQDVTLRKQAETARNELVREQFARRQAEDTIRMKDQFLAMVSHELRTPLTAVLGWVRILIHKEAEPDHVARGLEVIERNAQMQARLVDDLIDVVEASTGRLRLDARPVDLLPVAHAAIDAVRVSKSAKQLQMSTTFSEDLWVHGDPSRLQQVIWNLLSNAVKFTPENGRVELAVASTDDHVSIRVSDTGEGIDGERLERIFEPFWQGDPSRRHGGLGLGLAIVRTLVEAHGGTVSAESPGTGFGTTFSVRLPRLRREPGQPS